MSPPSQRRAGRPDPAPPAYPNELESGDLHVVRGAGTGEILLSLLAALLVIAGVAAIVGRRQVLGTLLVVVGLFVGPGMLALLR